MRLTTTIVPTANATPTHSATTTMFASVSLPVWSGGSQLSNSSAIGAPRLMARIAAIASRRTTIRSVTRVYRVNCRVGAPILRRRYGASFVRMIRVAAAVSTLSTYVESIWRRCPPGRFTPDRPPLACRRHCAVGAGERQRHRRPRRSRRRGDGVGAEQRHESRADHNEQSRRLLRLSRTAAGFVHTASREDRLQDR